MNESSEKAIKSIGRSITNINKQIDILRKEYPDAVMYVEDGVNYCVMGGSPNEGIGCPNSGAGNGRQDKVLKSFYVPYSECGAW